MATISFTKEEHTRTYLEFSGFYPIRKKKEMLSRWKNDKKEAIAEVFYNRFNKKKKYTVKINQ